MRRLASTLLVLGIVLAMLPATAAQPELDVAPFGIRGTLAGRTVEESVQVVNLSDEDFSVTGTFADVAVDEAGSFSAVASGTGLASASAWGSMEPASFQLLRGHTQTVRLIFKAPSDARAQGYYAGARFTGQGGGTTIHALHAVLLEIGGGEAVHAAEIASISVPSRSFGSTIPVTLRLTSSGNVYVVAQGRVVVRDMFSRITAVVQVGRTPVVPGTPRTLHIEVPAPIAPGRVRVSAEIGFGSGVASDTALANVYAVAWWHLAVAAFVLFVIVRMIVAFVRYRRRRKRVRRAAEPPSVKSPPVAEPTPAAARVNRKSRTPSVPSVPEAQPETQIVGVSRVSEPDLQSTWDAPSEDVVAQAEAHSAPPAPSPFEPASTFGLGGEDAEPPVIPRPRPERPADEPEPSTAEIFRQLEQEPEPEPEPEELEPEPEPEELEPEPELEPALSPTLASEPPAVDEPEPVVEPPVVPVPLPAIETPVRDEPALVPAGPAAIREQAPVDEPAPAAARAARLSERMLAGILEDSAGGPQASERRVRVAIDLLSGGSGRSSERVDVALKILAGAGADAVQEVETAFDQAVSAKRTGGLATIALALVRLESPRAPEALLRAYAGAARGQLASLKTALRSYDRKALRGHSKLLKALPPDRLAALKLG